MINEQVACRGSCFGLRVTQGNNGLVKDRTIFIGKLIFPNDPCALPYLRLFVAQSSHPGPCAIRSSFAVVMNQIGKPMQPVPLRRLGPWLGFGQLPEFWVKCPPCHLGPRIFLYSLTKVRTARLTEARPEVARPKWSSSKFCTWTISARRTSPSAS